MTREQAIRKGRKKTLSSTAAPLSVPQTLARAWLLRNGASGIEGLHVAGTALIRVLEDMERAGALRLPFPAYQEAMVDLRRALS